MKKRLALLLIAVLAMGLVACGKAKDGKTETTGNTTVETTEATEPAAETTTDAAQVSESTETKALESVKITTLNANKEEVEITVPYNPQRIAILDLAVLDIIDNLGLGDRVVGTANTSIDYLSDYVNNKDIKNLGTIKEADLEAVM